MKFERFEDIIVWQKAKELTLQVYRSFDELKDFAFKNQIQKASVSVMNNIAEGFERRSNSEFRHFLFIAKGSCGEVRSMLFLARDLEFCANSDVHIMIDRSEEVSRMLSGLIKAL